jgi:hypothetical protein
MGQRRPKATYLKPTVLVALHYGTSGEYLTYACPPVGCQHSQRDDVQLRSAARLQGY